MVPSRYGVSRPFAKLACCIYQTIEIELPSNPSESPMIHILPFFKLCHADLPDFLTLGSATGAQRSRGQEGMNGFGGLTGAGAAVDGYVLLISFNIWDRRLRGGGDDTGRDVDMTMEL